MLLELLLRKARDSSLYLALLNLLFRLKIPFNAPHGIKITALSPDRIEVRLPFRRINLNHVGGVHACALATASEFATGVLLLSHLKASAYRLLMKSLQVEYHYQAKSAVTVECTLTKDWIETAVKNPLQSAESVTASVEARAYDTARNLLSTTKVTWHIKSWEKVRERKSG